MAYYPDLSRYDPMGASDRGEAGLSVGWLSREYPYSTRIPDSVFVDALLRCYPELQSRHGAQMRLMNELVLAPLTPTDTVCKPIASAVLSVSQLFGWARHGERTAQAASLKLVAEVLEHAHEAGLMDWGLECRATLKDPP